MSWPFDRERGLILIPVAVWGPNGDWAARLVLDTGAAATLISPHVLALVGYDTASASQSVQLVTASGTVSAPRFAIEGIEALGLRRSTLAVVCYELPSGTGADGVLGLDFLRGHRLVVDFREGLITLD